VTDHNFALPADAASVGGGWFAAMCVDATGGTWPWLLAPGGDQLPCGCMCRKCAPHEQNGPIPRAWATDNLPTRCGRPRHDGKPCRQPDPSGHGCPWHRDEETP
jgi:hypothetical protein